MDSILASGNFNYEACAEVTFGKILITAGRPREALAPPQHSALLQQRRGDRAFEAEALDTAASTAGAADAASGVGPAGARRTGCSGRPTAPAPVIHPALPHTGADVIPLAGLGALTLLAGASAVRVASRKSES